MSFWHSSGMEASFSFIGSPADIHQIRALLEAQDAEIGGVEAMQPGGEGGAFVDPELILEGAKIVSTILTSASTLLTILEKWNKWRRDRQDGAATDSKGEVPLTVIDNGQADKKLSIEVEADGAELRRAVAEFIEG